MPRVPHPIFGCHKEGTLVSLTQCQQTLLSLWTEGGFLQSPFAVPTHRQKTQ